MGKGSHGHDGPTASEEWELHIPEGTGMCAVVDERDLYWLAEVALIHSHNPELREAPAWQHFVNAKVERLAQFADKARSPGYSVDDTNKALDELGITLRHNEQAREPFTRMDWVLLALSWFPRQALESRSIRQALADGLEQRSRALLDGVMQLWQPARDQKKQENLQALEMIAQGNSIDDAAKAFGLSTDALDRTRRRARKQAQDPERGLRILSRIECPSHHDADEFLPPPRTDTH